MDPNPIANNSYFNNTAPYFIRPVIQTINITVDHVYTYYLPP